MKICTIGCGKNSSDSHGPSYRKCAELDSELVLAACCDIDADKAVRYKESYGFAKYYTDYREMLKKEKPDAVCVVVPVHVTAGLVIELLNMKLPVIMEKPPGLDKTQTETIIEASQRNGVPAQVAFNRRHAPLIRTLKKLMKEHLPSPDDIQNISYDLLRVNRPDADFSTTAIHGIDLMQYMAGSAFKHVEYRYQELNQFGSAVANTLMYIEFESGATGFMKICPVTGVVVERTVICAHDQTFYLNQPIAIPECFDTPGLIKHVVKGFVAGEYGGENDNDGGKVFEMTGFYDENRAFFDAIKNGTPVPDPVESTLRSVMVAEGMRNRTRTLDF